MSYWRPLFIRVTAWTLTIVFSLAAALLLLEIALRFIASYDYGELSHVLSEAQRLPHSSNRVVTGRKLILSRRDEVDVLAVGDSFVFGSLVQSNARFTEKLEAMTRLRTYNLGVVATGPLEYNQMLHIGLKARPKIVLYMLFANDFCDLQRDRIAAAAEGTYYVFSDHFRQSSDRFRYYLKAGLVNRSMIWNSRRYLRAYMPDATEHMLHWYKGEEFSLSFVGRDFWDACLHNASAEVQEAVSIGVDAVVDARDEAIHAGAEEFIVLLAPSKEMVYIPVLKKEDAAWSALVRETYFDTFSVFSHAVQDQGITVVDLTTGLQDYAEKGEKLYFTIDGHWNELGHTRVAEVLADLF